MPFRGRGNKMTELEENLGPAGPELLEPQNALAVIRHNGQRQYWLSDRENLILDWKKWRQDFIAAGYAVPELDILAKQRSGIAILDQNNIEQFLTLSDVHRIEPEFLRKELLNRFDDAQSWWDVDFLFPIAHIDFDNKCFAGFYQSGPRLEQYLPDGWKGEFTDFANTYSKDEFPNSEKFWIADDKDLLRELIERGRKSADASIG